MLPRAERAVPPRAQSWEREVPLRPGHMFFFFARVVNRDPAAGRTVLVPVAVGNGSSAPRELVCPLGDRVCAPLLLARQQAAGPTVFRVALSDSPASPLAALGGNVLFEFVQDSVSFVAYEVSFKYACLAASAVVAALFLRRYFLVPAAERMLEQRGVALLLMATPALDDAPVILHVAAPGLGPRLATSVLQATFLAGVLLFWVTTLGAICSPPSRIGWARFHLPKVGLVALFWTAMAGSHAYSSWSATFDPSASAAADQAGALGALRAVARGNASAVAPAQGLALVAAGCAVVYALWLCAVIARTLPEVFTMPGHYTVTFFFTLAVIAATLVGLVSGALEPVHNEAAQYVSFVLLLNLYVWVMAFFYAPTVQATRTASAGRSALLQDASKFSIDDEDDGITAAEGAGRHDPTKFAI